MCSYKIPECISVANSPIHRVYQSYNKFRRTQNIDEMCFFTKESINTFKCFPNKSIKKMQTDYFAQVMYHHLWLGSLSQSYAVNAWDCSRTYHRNEQRYPFSHSFSMVLHQRNEGECSLKQSAGTAKYCGELSFLKVIRTKFC